MGVASGMEFYVTRLDVTSAGTSIENGTRTRSYSQTLAHKLLSFGLTSVL